MPEFNNPPTLNSTIEEHAAWLKETIYSIPYSHGVTRDYRGI